MQPLYPRPVEVVERVEESTTEPNFKHEVSPWSEFNSLRLTGMNHQLWLERKLCPLDVIWLVESMQKP